MRRIIMPSLLLLLISLSAVSAAPAPWGIAINPETRECGGYWAGDEYVSAALPQGWDAYYPAYYPEGNDIIKTAFGDCVFRKEVGDPPGEAERCCDVLGLDFVSEDVGQTGLLSYPMLNLLALGAALLVFMAGIVWLVVWLLRKAPGKR